MGKLILLRHGQSMWNLENKFTGWTDVDLAPQGIKEAKAVGRLLKGSHVEIDRCFSSYLKRAIRTQWLVLEQAEQLHIDASYSWKLNERHYGDWQGKDKDGVLQEIGEEPYWNIRRGFDTPPPPVGLDDSRHPRHDSNYRQLDPQFLPSTESLQDTQIRVLNHFYGAIAPHLVMNQTVLVTAHGNSLRALIAHLEQTPPLELPFIEVPTGVPFLYVLDPALRLVSHQKMT
ncbi:2,3-bisphosphoglycerate-dependent phosphoglycerate mutase [Flagellimonas beolgyonensis]|uniref:2,3-bisphosphoglycerate-dependent phosphoglycerate mutase n=1 Tax=Flagellimonas beolgyonensis TaxID=864064 RepID=UPI003D65D32B